MNIDNTKDQFPLFYKTANHLSDKANFFKNSFPKLFNSKYDYVFAERICQTGLKACSNNWDEYLLRVENLIKLSFDFLKLQMMLEKNGKYLYSSFEEVEKLYSENDEQPGPDYLWGLYFSEIFWKIHCNLTKFFVSKFIEDTNDHGKVLEIPIGTGFYLSEFLLKKPNWIGLGIDLAQNAIKFSNTICNLNKINENNFKIIQKNFLEFETIEKFDRIICGEFLEHVEDPILVLKKLKNLLTDNGKIFITAAIWSGGIDHIYLYKTTDEVRDQISQIGLKIEIELPQAVFEKDEQDIEKEKTPINYSAILSKS